MSELALRILFSVVAAPLALFVVLAGGAPLAALLAACARCLARRVPQIRMSGSAVGSLSRRRPRIVAGDGPLYGPVVAPLNQEIAADQAAVGSSHPGNFGIPMNSRWINPRAVLNLRRPRFQPPPCAAPKLLVDLLAGNHRCKVRVGRAFGNIFGEPDFGKPETQVILGAPPQFQAPLSVRVGGRFSF